MLMSDTLRQLPVVAVDYIFVSPEMRQAAECGLKAIAVTLFKEERKNNDY